MAVMAARLGRLGERGASRAVGEGAIAANHAASRPRGCQARLTASMPLHTLPYSSGAAWGTPRGVRGCGFMSGLLFVWPRAGRDVDRQEKGAEGRVAFGSGGRSHRWDVAGLVAAGTHRDRKSGEGGKGGGVRV